MDIRTVAEAAKVSISTVSRVMNNAPNVDRALSDRVWAKVRELGYVPNIQARALVSGKSQLFGVIISDITNPFFPELIQGFEESALIAGYETLISSTNYEPRKMEICIQRMLERKVDGVAVMTFGIEQPLLTRLSNAGIPMVFVDVAPEGPLSSAISVNYDAGIGEAVQHLAVLGHRRIAFISGPRSLRSADSRSQAFLRAIRGIGLTNDPEYTITGDHTAEGGQAAAASLLSLDNRPTAIMCSNDLTAIGAMHAAADLRLKIPDDLSLIGFDDTRLAKFMLPPLTSIRMSGQELSAAAVNSLVAFCSGETFAAVRQRVTTRLIVRQSTAIPKNSLADLKVVSS